MTEFESVIELTNWYDGPRDGVAYFQGRPHAFKSRMLDVYGNHDATDLFDLIPVGATTPTVVAHAEFRRIGSVSLPAGEWPVLEVLWTPEGATGA
jgi:hypothetical protein